MIHPALYKLMRLQTRATARKMLRGGATPARLAFLALGALLVIGYLTMIVSQTRQAHTEPQWVRMVVPLALLLICIVTAITSVGDKAIAFTPGEVDQLFPGPFSRRELLAYKLMKSGALALITALVLSTPLYRHARWYPACLAGAYLSLLFIQFFSIVLLLTAQALGASLYSRFRRLTAFVALAAAALLVSSTFRGVHNGREAIMRFYATRIGRVATAPFMPFGELITADTLAGVLKWGLAALAVVGVLLLAVLQLDAYYLETAMTASERRYAKIQRARSGGILSIGVSKTATWTLPLLPWAGGAGPIAWRQATSAARSSQGLVILLVIVAIGVTVGLSHVGSPGDGVRLMEFVVGYVTFLCSSMLSFDFRGDVDHMENLKSLPLRGWAVVLGELIVPTVILSAIQIALLMFGAAQLPHQRRWLLIAASVAPAFSLLLFAAENLNFLLFPSRPAAASPGDFQALGRKFIFMIARLVALSIACFVAMIPAVVVYTFTGKRLISAAVTGNIVLWLEAAALIPLLAWAYRRYDPSLQSVE